MMTKMTISDNEGVDDCVISLSTDKYKINIHMEFEVVENEKR